MRHLFSSLLSLVLLAGLLLAGPRQARASHVQGGQLTYLNVGTNQYVVTLYLYRDCSGATLPATMSLTLQQGCTGTVAGTYPMNPVVNSISVGTQYCPAQQSSAQCTSTATLPNYETQQYRTATITIAPGQWLLSTEVCCRPTTANLVGQENFRYEAALNNQLTVNGQLVTIQNNSPQYSALDVPVPFVPVNQSTTISFNTNDPDNSRLNPTVDSLVYSLTSPLEGCNVPVPYVTYPPANITSTPPCYIFPPTNYPTSYGASLPIAVGFNTTGTCPTLQGTTMQFAYADGQFTFTPNRYLNTAPINGDNKYVVVGRVDDYRRLPGSNRRYLVGSVRREILVIVTSNTNNVPAAPTGTAATPHSGTTIASSVDSLNVTIQPCSYSQVLVRFTDPDPGQLLTVAYTGVGTIPVNVLDSGDIGTYSLTGNNTATPVARFLFQPSPAFSGRVLRIPFQIQDNACPVRGLQTRILIVTIAPARNDLATIAVAVGSSGTVTGNVASVCPGNSLTLNGAVIRPDSVRGRLQTYAYAWTGNGIVGSASSASVAITPLVTTRYRLTVTPVSGFQTGLCSDTASMLVQVVPQPAAPTITRAGNTLISSSSTGNQWYLNGVAIAGATGSTFVPTTAGSYTVAATAGTGAVLCTSPASAAVLGTRSALPGSSLHIVPNPTPDGHLTVLLTGYRQATTLTLIDAVGRTVHTATLAVPNATGSSLPLDLSQLPAGVYALRVSTAGGVDVCRVVRQ